ncbi:MAG: anthranilate synthase component I family protein [Saprospiraceae bacterium]
MPSHTHQKKILAAIRQLTPTASSPILSDIQIQARVPKSEYLQNVAAIQQHIIEGDLYEMNYCQEFYAEQAEITPITLFEQLNNLTQSPFAAFYKNRQQYVLCASPERFIKKIGRKIISQPIKGTMRRGSSNAEDAWLQQALANSEKDRAENVMIVDLVRNDFARSCQSGSVQVEELFGIYTFRQVHQMISTISGTLRKNVSWVTAIRNAFPMGSMTGAPKVMAMQLIEQYEASKRGLYSGAIGYITPRGNFDFNVVIRSLLYNAANRYLSFQVGGAIVYDSEPEKEYEECLLKASAIMRVLQNER